MVPTSPNLSAMETVSASDLAPIFSMRIVPMGLDPPFRPIGPQGGRCRLAEDSAFKSDDGFRDAQGGHLTKECRQDLAQCTARRNPERGVLVFIQWLQQPVRRLGLSLRADRSRFRRQECAHTWPSRGRLLACGYDREITNYTRNTLEAQFQYLAAYPEVKEVSILANSMGNWLALEGLRQMDIRNDGPSPKFKNVMLAGPDVELLRSQIKDIEERRPRFTLFVSADDRALAFSPKMWATFSGWDPSIRSWLLTRTR